MPLGAQVLSHFLPGPLEHVTFVLMVGHGCKMATPHPADICIIGRKKGQWASSMPTMLVSHSKAFPGSPLGKFGLIIIGHTRITWLLPAARESRRVGAFS